MHSRTIIASRSAVAFAAVFTAPRTIAAVSLFIDMLEAGGEMARSDYATVERAVGINAPSRIRTHILLGAIIANTV